MIHWIIRILHRLEKKDKHFVSTTDRVIRKFDRENPRRSDSQLAEIKKHRRIFERPTPSKIRW